MTTTKILHVINSFEIGGAEVLVRQMALAHDRKRFENDLWALASRGKQQTEEMFVEDLTGSHVPFHCMRKKSGVKDPRVVARLVRQIRARRYDIVHTHCVSPDMYGRVAATLVPGTRRVSTIHCMMPPEQIRFERMMSGLVDLYVPCSDEIADVLQQQCLVPASRCRTVLNGTIGDRRRSVNESRAAIRARYGLSADQKAALMVARFSPVKCHLDLVQAFAIAGDRLRNLHVWLAGNDTLHPEHTEKIRAAIREHGLEDRLHILGPIPVPELDALFKAADLFVLPSDREGHSLAIMEAMAAALPSVISDLVPNRLMSDDGRTAWLVPPHDPARLAATLEQVVADPHAAERRGEAAEIYIQQHFALSRTVAEYAAVYDEVMARPPVSATRGLAGAVARNLNQLLGGIAPRA